LVSLGGRAGVLAVSVVQDCGAGVAELLKLSSDSVLFIHTA
jgi:hypothetical protein